MKKALIATAIALSFTPLANAASPIASITKEWTYSHAATGVSGLTSEITAYDAVTNTIWVAGVVGVDVLNASNGALVQHINTSASGSINSISIHNGLAAFAIEAPTRTNAGVVQLYDTTSRSLASGVNTITVGALPDMLTFTADGSKLLVANEGTPSTYGVRLGTTIPRNYGEATLDPVGSVSIIDMTTRHVVAAPTLSGVPTAGSHIRTNTGMDYEPEYITVNSSGTKAYVTLQEANAIGILDIASNSFEKIVGLGVKDFSQVGNSIDPLNNGTVSFISPNVKGLYMPDGIAAYEAAGNTYLVMANEGDFREDDGDRSTAGNLGAVSPLNNLRISNTDSSVGDLYAAGARSFSIRDANGNLIYDSGSILDMKAAELGIYDDGRSRDKGVEPEGVELLKLNGRVIAAIGLERTTKGAIALFDVTDPTNASFLDMIVADGDLAPEGLKAFERDGKIFLSIANEGSNTTSVYAIAAVPEPESYAMMALGLGLITLVKRRKRSINQ